MKHCTKAGFTVCEMSEFGSLLYSFLTINIIFFYGPSISYPLQTRLLIKNTQSKHKFKNKILFNLAFIIISFMTHKNSILELTEEHRYRTNAHRCTQKKTRSMWRYLPKLSSVSSTYGMLRPILVFPKKFSRKAAIRLMCHKRNNYES
jgi:hypothetical protein